MCQNLVGRLALARVVGVLLHQSTIFILSAHPCRCTLSIGSWVAIVHWANRLRTAEPDKQGEQHERKWYFGLQHIVSKNTIKLQIISSCIWLQDER